MRGNKALLLAAAVPCSLPCLGQTIPKTPNEVARPGGKVPGNPKLALVKVADGFKDPTGVSVAELQQFKRVAR
jgi:hypothetical protein